MKINFQDPAKGNSEIWRGVVTIVMVVFLIGGLVVKKTNLMPRILLKLLTYNQSINLSFSSNGQIGEGDVVVNPPEVSKPKLPQLTGEKPLPESYSAQAMLVKDHATGAILYGKNEYKSWPMASITKLMSALVILANNPDWATSTQVISDDVIDTHMYAGDTYTLEEFWNAALVGSSNKAILALINALGKSESEFVVIMNNTAKELGMDGTSFSDATGLSDTNTASASDVLLLLSEAVSNEKIAKTLLTKEYNLYSVERDKSHHLWNTDWLLLGWIQHNFTEFYGGKTGYIQASGYNFTVQVGDGKGHILDVVVLGADSHENRFIEARNIAEWAFANYQWPE